MTKKTAIQLKLDPNKPESEFKLLGGGKMDEWNKRLSEITVNALPIARSKNKDAITEAYLAVSYGVMDMAPADPVEGNIDRTIDGGERGCARALPKGLAERERASVFRGWNEISATCRQGSADGGAVDRKARPPSRPRATTDHGEACDHEQRHRRSGDHCRECHHRRRSQRRVSCAPGR